MKLEASYALRKRADSDSFGSGCIPVATRAGHTYLYACACMRACVCMCESQVTFYVMIIGLDGRRW